MPPPIRETYPLPEANRIGLMLSGGTGSDVKTITPSRTSPHCPDTAVCTGQGFLTAQNNAPNFINTL